MTHIIAKLFTIQLLVAVFTVSTFAPAAKAAVIDTQTVLSQQNRSTQAELHSIFAREDVRQQLIAYGVNPDDAGHRIASLTSHELNQLQLHINDLPAGSDGLAILGAVFLVLLVLELVGVTNIFSKF
ncbi:MAG: PA2779 family protein [Desulforhopalus sp.]